MHYGWTEWCEELRRLAVERFGYSRNAGVLVDCEYFKPLYEFCLSPLLALKTDEARDMEDVD